MKNKYLIQVAPLIRLPITRTQVFSYSHFEPIERGSLVEVPFYNRVVSGIVMESRSDFPRSGNFVIKKIRRIVQKEAVLEKQIQLAKSVADFYLLAPGLVLKSMIHKNVKARKKKKQDSNKLEILKTDNQARELANWKEKEIVLIGPKKERDQIIFSAIKQTLKKNRQFLYLASETFPAAVFFEKMKKYFLPREAVLVHGGVSKGEIFEAQEKIRKGTAKIIVATKIGLFLPFRDLGAIAVEESGDISHKQWDMNPRYNAERVAQMLSNIHGGKLIHSNSTLSLDLWKRKKEESLKVVPVGLPGMENSEIKIVNIFREKNSLDFPIGKELHSLLSKVIDKKGKSLLILNRRGLSSYSVCRNCKKTLRCPDCERALVYFEEKEKYACLHCSYKVDLLSVCPNCGASQFSHQGAGVQLIEKKIKRLFPSARILRLDADISKSKKKNERILKDFFSGNFDILIGTQIALKLGGFQRFDLVAFPSFDDLGSLPDFNSRESVFAMLKQAEGAAGGNGLVIVQTAYPDNFLLVSFQNKKQEEFFENEAKERKKMSYPPFSCLVKIFYREKDKKRTETETGKTADLLKNLADSSIDVSDPYDPFVPKKRGYYYKNILIKINSRTEIRELPIFPVLGGLKKGWSIDKDPINTV